MAVASPPSTAARTAQFEFSVGGMTCAACAARVQSRLNKVPGVSAAVNFASERAVVLAPASITAGELTAVIEAAGYIAELASLARDGVADADAAVSMGIVAPCGWSVYAMFFLVRTRGGMAGLHQVLHGSGGGIYLEVAASVTTFLLAGRLYEAKARRTAGQAMRDLAAAGAKDVRVLGDDGAEQLIPAVLLRTGQRFVVRPGERIAADGTVLAGESAVDGSMMTGESVPADAVEGDSVTGGTIALTGRLIVRADRTGPDTQLARLITMVEQAQASKAAIQRLADRVCAVFVPCVLACAAATLAGWLLAGGAPEDAVSAALAVLIIACPCALGLATTAALVAASGRGAQLGVFIKGYQALESSRAVDTVVLDKTGTVTTGQMTLTALHAVPGTSRGELLAFAGAVEHASEHPVAAAIAAAARAEGPVPEVQEFAALPGLGARGLVAEHEVLLGLERLFVGVPADLAAWCADQETDGRTTVLVGWDGAVRGALAVADTVKPSAAAAVAELRRLGLRPVLLTGDNEATTRSVAAAAGIDEVISGTLPGQKARVIADLEASGSSAAMVGDGVNDGPALAGARLGLALAGSRFLNPLVAAAAMTLSSVFVVWNSLRLRRFPGSTVLEVTCGP